MAAIFISHSSRDNDLARDVKTWLVAEGFEQVFLDFDKHTGLRAGEHWERRLYQEVERCHAVVLILTPNWLDSKWCFVEFTQARALGKVIFPIVSTPLGGAIVAPEIQGVDLERWDAEGQQHLRTRIRAIGDESARGFAWDRSRSPYPGIHAFDRADAAIFFGRDPEVRDVCERLEAHRVQGGRRLVLIVGASGSGKSSLLRAGIVPRLERERRRWLVLPAFRPEREPVTHLAKSLAEIAGRPNGWRAWRDGLLGPERQSALASILDDLRIGEARHAVLLVPVDQFEEIFTVAGDAERAAMLDLLAAIERHDLPVVVVATIRSDMLGEALETAAFTCAFDDYPLRAMPADRIPKIVEGPAGVHAVSVERGLGARIAQDVTSPDSLPLLAFALREMFERFCADNRLTVADYERLGDAEAGLTPIENAVRQRAEEVLRLARPDAKTLAALRSAFVFHLVRVREDGGFVRQPGRLADLPEASRRLVDHFVDARLLGRRLETGEDGREVPVVEVAHEALFRAWPLLRGWLGEESEFLATKAQVARGLAEWRRTPKALQAEALPGGLALRRAEPFLATHPSGFSRDEASFVKAGARRVRRRKRILAGIVVAALLTVAAALAPKLYAEYGRRTALECDLLAAEEDNSVNVPGVPFDKIVAALAIPACERAVAAAQDNPRLIHNLGRAYDVAGRYPEAVARYRVAADLGWAWSMNYLGVMTLHGQGTPPHFARGVALIRMAAERGNRQAETNYTDADYELLFVVDKSGVGRSGELAALLREALVQAGSWLPDSAGREPSLQSAVALYKARHGMTDTGISLRVLDRLGIVDRMEAVLAKGRS